MHLIEHSFSQLSEQLFASILRLVTLYRWPQQSAIKASVPVVGSSRIRLVLIHSSLSGNFNV